MPKGFMQLVFVFVLLRFTLSENKKMFPETLMTQGPCEMSVRTYAFVYLRLSVEKFEKSSQTIKNMWSRDFRQDIQFFTWYGEMDEHGRLEVRGMVQFVDKYNANEDTAKVWLAYRMSSSHPHFLQRIQDVNINKVYRYIKKQEAKVGLKHFERGVFVGFVDLETEQDPDVVEEAIVAIGHLKWSIKEFEEFVNNWLESQ